MEHQFYNGEEALAEGGEDSALYRVVALGGLGVCKVCHCYEGSLATHCPGTPVSAAQQDLIYAGTLDYVDGAWVGEWHAG